MSAAARMQRSRSDLLSGASTFSNSSLRSVDAFSITSSIGSTTIAASTVLRLSSVNTRRMLPASRPFSAHVLHTKSSRANSGHVSRFSRRPVNGFQPGTLQSCWVSTAFSCVNSCSTRIVSASSSVGLVRGSARQAAKVSKESRGTCSTRANTARKCQNASASSTRSFGSRACGANGSNDDSCGSSGCEQRDVAAAPSLRAGRGAFSTTRLRIMAARTGKEKSSRGEGCVATFSSSCVSRCRLRVFTCGCTALSCRLRVLYPP